MENEETIKSSWRPVAKRILKISGRIAGILLLVVLCIIWLIQLPAFQKIAIRKTSAYLQQQLGAEVRIGKLSINFPKMVVLHQVYFADIYGDTLLYGGRLGVNLKMFDLLQGKVHVNEIWLSDIQANIVEDTSGRYNFDHFIQAFGGSGDNPPSETTNNRLEITLNRLKIDRTRVHYAAATIGLDGHFHITQLRAGIQNIDLDKQIFRIKNLDWHGGDVNLRMWDTKNEGNKPDVPDSVAHKNVLPHFLASNAALSEIAFVYANPDDGMDMVAGIGALTSKGLDLDLTKQHINLGDARLFRSSFAYKSGPSLPSPPSATASPNWIITATNIALLQNRFVYDDIQEPRISRGLDYNHMSFSGINLQGKELYVSGGDTVRAVIESGSLSEKSGLKISDLSTQMLYTTKGIQLRDLNLITPYTRLRQSIEIGYESPSMATERPGDLWIDADLKNARVGHKDLLTAVPLLYEYPMFADFPSGIIEVDGLITGFLKDLSLRNVTARAFGGTRVRASGRISGLPDAYAISTNLNISELTTTDGEIRKMIPEGLIPDYVTLPASMTLKGKLTGSFTENLGMDVSLQSNLGNAKLAGFINKADDPINATYDLKGSLDGFDAGKLIGNPDLGKLTLGFSAKGKSYEPGHISGRYEAHIDQADFAGISYRDVDLKADADNGLASGTLFSTAEPHQFNLDFRADMRGEFPALTSQLNLGALDLQYLGYSDKPFIVTGQTDMDFPRLDPDHPQGFFFVTQLSGLYDTTLFQLDSLYAIASLKGSEQNLLLKTDFGKAEISGQYSVAALLPEIQNFINLYYVIARPVPALRGDQKAKINLQINPSPALFQFLPDLQLARSINFSLDFNSSTCLFDLKGSLPPVVYGNQYIAGASIVAKTNDSALSYKIFIDEYASSIYEIPTLLMQGDIMQHVVYTDIRLLDASGKLQHTLIANISQKDSGYAIHIDPGSVLLDYDKWGLDPGNELYIAPDYGIFANAFTFSNGSQALIMQTWGDNPNDPIGIRLFNFKISTITGLARQDSLYLDGTVNGTAEIQLHTETPVFLTDLTISDLTFKRDTIGNINLIVVNEQPDIYTIKGSMGGYDNDLSIAGDYNGALESFDIQFDIEKLNMVTLQPFAMGYLTNMKGHLEGGISLTGTVESPVVIGNMVFRDAEAKVPLLNSVFSLRNERIRFLRDGMHFNEFTLTDQNAKKAILNGTMLTRNWIDFIYNLDFNANDFRVINSTRRDNRQYFGTLFLDTHIKFRGNTDRPDIISNFRANEKTDLTMVLPQTDPEIAEREGVMVWYNASIPDADSVYAVKIDSLNSTKITGLSLSANLEIDPNARLSFIIDETNGDMLVAKGSANLSTSLDPSGKVSLTGKYELKEGTYDMSLKMLKFKFQIETGSTIVWTGEPTTADINITALYNVKTAPYDLVEQQILGESAETQAKYKDRMPFRVKLKVRGELLKPDISFDMEIAETSGTSADVISTVNSKLDQLRLQESEMNKQVFALILFGSFIPDNPFGSSSGGASASAFARQSVSKLLSDQLNQLAGSLISGVDVDIGIQSEEDYSMGTGEMRTDLNVAFSKRLLKDRLKITVGSNFELEGSARPNEKTSNIAGDIKADYLLTRSGQYVLRAYRIDQYEVALQGQVVETGITFIINLDFDVFKEIFERKRKTGELKR